MVRVSEDLSLRTRRAAAIGMVEMAGGLGVWDSGSDDTKQLDGFFKRSCGIRCGCSGCPKELANGAAQIGCMLRLAFYWMRASYGNG